MKLGCSSFSWHTEDNKHLLGRTYDQFGNLEGNRIVFMPKNYTFKLEISEENIAYAKAHYSFTGMAVLGLSTPIMVDGINEKGLMGALLHYPGYATYDTQKSESTINIHPGFFVTYLLSQCASIDEVVEKVAKVNLTNEHVFGQEMAVHYIFSDTTGETIIIEPDAKGITVHKQTIGVITNSPDYLWHKTNLRNFVGVTNLSKPPQIIVNTQITEFGERLGGGFGLPGDYSSPSRFVRMAFLKQFAVKGKDELDGITKMFHNFASVDTPEGILKADSNYEYYEKTLCTSVMCAESLTYYFSTSTNRRLSAIHLENEKHNTEIKFFDLHEQQDILYLN